MVVAVADLAARGLLFRGSFGDAGQLLRLHRRDPAAAGDSGPRSRPIGTAFTDQMKAVAQAEQLAVELGLTVTSRTRAFTAQKASDDGWSDVIAS